MNLKQAQLLLGVFLLGVSLTAMFFDSREPVLSAQDFIEGCNNRFGYASWRVESVPTKDSYTYTCVPDETPDLNNNWTYADLKYIMATRWIEECNEFYGKGNWNPEIRPDTKSGVCISKNMTLQEYINESIAIRKTIYDFVKR